MTNKTYCRYPFTALAIKNFYKNKLLSVWPCCMMGSEIAAKGEKQNYDRLGIQDVHLLTPQEIFDHPRMEQLRNNLSSGVRDPACEVCWNQEDREFAKSAREYSYENESYITHIPKLEEIDITISNVCNLRCRMCNPTSSNLLMVDYQYFTKNGLLDKASTATGGRWWISNPHSTEQSLQWKWLIENTDKITHLKMSGGEPFYDRKVLELLEMYVKNDDAKNTTLTFHTNATQFTDEVVTLLAKFKMNNHSLSIDGADRVYEYIRHPASFKELNDSLTNYFLKVPTRREFTHLTLVASAYNILSINKFNDWAKTLDTNAFLNYQEIYPMDRGVVLKHLPIYILEEAKKRVQPYLESNFNDNRDRLRNLIAQIDNAILYNAENKQLMKDEMTVFDLSRNQSYRDHLDPMLIEWLDSE